MKIDTRTIKQVEDTRCSCNRKPFRSKAERKDARFHARRDRDGAVRSHVRASDPTCRCGAMNAKARLECVSHI
jgi:hypothetical protein